jgi:hypothetical protein
VAGDTTAATFTALEQTESQSQSGLFASSETPIDLTLLCVKLHRVDSSRSELPCNSGFLKLEHVYIEALRLGQNTTVDLLVVDKDLEVTLTANSSEKSLVTLLFDSHSRVSEAQAHKIEGEWTIDTGDAPIHMTFLHPRFHSGDDEGGQSLSPGSAFAFQHDGRSGFINNTGTYSIADIESDLRKPLNDDLIQVYSLKSGKVRTLSPVLEASDGSLSALRVELQGTSDDIQTKGPLSDTPSNRASDSAEHLIGMRFTRGWLFTTVWVPALIALCAVIAGVHYGEAFSKRRKQ